MTSTAAHFRPDLEGLRAVAVVLVLLYHAGVPGFSGGYVGVDVFFVLSGFLITGVILRELRTTGTLSLTGFYARRARRLLPAAALTLMVTLVASVLLLNYARIPEVAADIASAALYVSNLRFGVQANDYFHATGMPSPVLHFWSLSVEEQFYIFWPTILLSLVRISRHHRGRPVVVASGIAVISALSLVAAVWLTDVNQPWAFFLLPTRAWELGLGALIFTASGRLVAMPRLVGVSSVVAGLLFIVFAAVSYSDATAFPGMAAVVPVTGAGLVIAGGMVHGSTIPGRALSAASMRFLGRVSYSVYLWHWPLLVFGATIAGQALPWTIAAPVALAAIPIATLTQNLIEDPLRRGRIVGLRPRINIAQALVSSLLIFALCAGGAVYAHAELDAKLGYLIPPVGGPLPVAGVWCQTTDQVDHIDRGTCVHGVPNGAVTVVLFGDSHAEHWYSALERIALKRGWRLVTLVRGNCTSLFVEYINTNLNRVEPECAEWREHALARIASESPDLVVVSNLRRYSFVVDGNSTNVLADVLQATHDGLVTLLRRFTPLTRSVAVIGDVPGGFDVPDCLLRNPDNLAKCAVPVANVPTAWHEAERTAALSNGATFIDPTPWLCDATMCPLVFGDYVAYYNINHLTAPFSANLADRLDEALPPLEQRSP